MHQNFSRRLVLGGIASATFAQAGFSADAPTSLVARGVLADNKIAQAFEEAPRDLPDVTVVGPSGEQALSDLVKGRTVLMPLWAEWCAPCMIELSDFARLQEVYGNARFAIIPVLTGTTHKFTPQLLGNFLDKLRAGIFQPLMEADHGDRLMRVLARKDGNPSIPCNLLIGSDGHVVAREIGIKFIEDKTGQPPVGNNMKRLDNALAGNTQSLWGTPAGDEFATCLSGGFVTFP